MWDQYWRYIIGALVLIVAQTALIAGLLLQRAERERAERELRSSQARLRVSYERIRDLGRRLITEQDAERARIARELHDDINQQLAILTFDLDRLRADHVQVHTAQRLSRALQTAQGISMSVRELSHRLHPSRLQLVGLVGGLDGLRRDLSPPDREIDFCHRDVPTEISPDVALCLFRVAQEALGNAVQHSAARHIRVELTGASSCVFLSVTDDGKGFDLNHAANAGLGLMSMKERVESVGGTLEVQAAPQAGTHLRVCVPTQSVAAAAAGIGPH
jgi:signal transduction histidine kinase